MTRISLTKVGGICALLGPLSFLAGGVIEGVFGVQSFPEQVTELEEWARNWTDTAVMPGVVAFSVLAEALLVPAALGFYEVLRRDTGRILRLAVVTVIMGSIFLSASFLIETVNASEVAPSYLEADESARPALGVLAVTLRQLQLVLRWYGDVLAFGVGLGLFALASIRTSLVPTWIGWVGVLGALLAGWLAPLQSVSDVFGISFLGVPLLIVWMVWMGVTMLRSHPPAEIGEEAT